MTCVDLETLERDAFDGTIYLESDFSQHTWKDWDLEMEEVTDYRYIHLTEEISNFDILHGSGGGTPRFSWKATERPRSVPPREESTFPKVAPGIFVPGGLSQV